MKVKCNEELNAICHLFPGKVIIQFLNVLLINLLIMLVYMKPQVTVNVHVQDEFNGFANLQSTMPKVTMDGELMQVPTSNYIGFSTFTVDCDVSFL